MKKLFSMLLVVIFVSVLCGQFTQGKDELYFRNLDNVEESNLIPDELIISYLATDMDESAKKIKDKYGLTQLEKGYKGNFEVVKVPGNKKLDDLIASISKEKEVKYVEKNYLAYTLADPVIPNDYYFHPQQWNLYEYGRLSNGIASNYGIQATLAWTVSTGNNVKVAIIDTGVAYETYGKFKIAPDLVNTKFDKVNAKNFSARNPTVHANDDNGHGTHVCGTIAQSTGNSIGCAGIAYNATILPIKVLNSSGSGSLTAIAQGITWAADHGADIINMSLGSTSGNTTLYDAVKYAYDAGVIIVCSSGNGGNTVRNYPAYYEECIAVGATRFDGLKASYSTYATLADPWLDIVAPGGETGIDENSDGYGDGILQQSFARVNSFGYYFFQGTSMASPHVAGVAALVLSAHPDWNAAQVREAMIMTANQYNSTEHVYKAQYGWGLVDAFAAINWDPTTP